MSKSSSSKWDKAIKDVAKAKRKGKTSPEGMKKKPEFLFIKDDKEHIIRLIGEPIGRKKIQYQTALSRWKTLYLPLKSEEAVKMAEKEFGAKVRDCFLFNVIDRNPEYKTPVKKGLGSTPEEIEDAGKMPEVRICDFSSSVLKFFLKEYEDGRNPCDIEKGTDWSILRKRKATSPFPETTVNKLQKKPLTDIEKRHILNEKGEQKGHLIFDLEYIYGDMTLLAIFQAVLKEEKGIDFGVVHPDLVDPDLNDYILALFGDEIKFEDPVI
jgi:hypothetical protein